MNMREMDLYKKIKISVLGLRGFPEIEGGVEKHCESLYSHLSNKYDITVYRRRPYVSSSNSYKNISFIDLPSTKIKGVEAFLHSFLASVDVLIKKPDVAHYHNIGPALFSPIVKLRRIPVVLTYHSPNYEHDKWGKFAKKLLLFSERVALKTADKVIFVNKFQMQKYSQEIQNKSIYVPNGINDLMPSQNTSYLLQLGIEPGKYILSVGRITQEKGFDVLIKAFNKANLDGIKLVIAGGVEFEDGYMKELKMLSEGKNVVFTGFVNGDNLAQLYTYAGLYVLASNNEGFPIVLLEAMKYGLDVLVSDIPATHLVNLDKDNYFPKGDSNVLAQKMRKKSIGFNRIKYEMSRYDWKQIAAIVGDIYDNVARREC